MVVLSSFRNRARLLCRRVNRIGRRDGARWSLGSPPGRPGAVGQANCREPRCARQCAARVVANVVARQATSAGHPPGMSNDAYADEVAAAVSDEKYAAEVDLAGRRRTQDSTRRSQRLTPRFSAQERAEIEVAAASVGMTVTGFCAEAAVAAARRLPMSYGAGQDREALARLQRQLFEARTAVNRFGNNVNQAVTALHSTGTPPVEALASAVALCSRAVRRVDELIDELHRRLR